MNRKSVLVLTGLGAAAAVGVFWPWGAPRLDTTVYGCSFAPSTPSLALEPAAAQIVETQPALAVWPQWTREPVRIAPLVTAEDYQAFENEVAAALPHVPAYDRWKFANYCAADTNRDNQIDAQDIAFFTHVWSKGDDGLNRLIDVNHDGVLDQQDYRVFIDAYFSGDCLPQQQETYRLMIC